MYGTTKKYGKITFRQRIARLIMKKGWYVYSTLRLPSEWMEV